MPYRVEIGSGADAQLGKLDSAIGASVERKILWLAKTPLPSCIGGWSACRTISPDFANCGPGDWRILYWVYHPETLIRIYRIQHRSEVYRDF